MKNIVIFGSYNSNSIGDTALLLGLISSINRIEKHCHITILTVRPLDIDAQIESLHINFTRKISQINVFHDKTFYHGYSRLLQWYCLRTYHKLTNRSLLNKRKIKEILQNADQLIIGGGNLIMDLYPEWPLIIRDLTDIALKAKIKYSFVGVGAAPISTEIGVKALQKALRFADKVYFRDRGSLEFCEYKLGFKKGIVAPDCVFGIDWHAENRHKPTLLVNLAAIYSDSWPQKSEKKFKAYIYAMFEAIRTIMKDNKLKDVLIFNTNYPLDEVAVLPLISLLEQDNIHYKYVKGQLTVGELIKLCSQADIALVTRLHASLLATIAKCKIIAVAYQPKVNDVLSEAGISKNIIQIDSLISSNDERWLNNPTYPTVNLNELRNQLDRVLEDILK